MPDVARTKEREEMVVGYEDARMRWKKQNALGDMSPRGDEKPV
jgi:hypothetical protein